MFKDIMSYNNLKIYTYKIFKGKKTNKNKMLNKYTYIHTNKYYTVIAYLAIC